MMARYTDRVESHCKPVAATNGPMEVVASATIAQMLQARYCAGASLTGRLNSDARPMYSDRAILNHTHSRNCRNPEYQLSHLGIKANASGQATAQPIRTDDPRANGIASISEATAASNLIDVLIGRLRRKLHPPGAVPLLHTRRGFGYQLADEA